MKKAAVELRPCLLLHYFARRIVRRDSGVKIQKRIGRVEKYRIIQASQMNSAAFLAFDNGNGRINSQDVRGDPKAGDLTATNRSDQ